MRRCFILLIGLLLIMNVSASFSVGNKSHEFTQVYAPSSNVLGWINLSLSNADPETLFSDSRGNNISLKDLIQENIDYIYSCSPSDCMSGYSPSNITITKTIQMTSGEEKLIGLLIPEGAVKGISNFSLKIQSNAGQNCNPQIKMDFLEDGLINYLPEISAPVPCGVGKNYNCYELDKPNQIEVSLPGSNSMFCQDFILSQAPGFYVGAWVKRATAESNPNAKIMFELRDENLDPIAGANCNASLNHSEISSGVEVSCSIEKTILGIQKVSLCFYKKDANADYKIKGFELSPSSACARTDLWEVNNAAYRVFMQPKAFASIGESRIIKNDDLWLMDLEYYLDSKYYNLTNNYPTCPSSGCVIPVKIISGADQTIVLSDLKIDYQAGIGYATASNFADITKVPFKFNSGYGKLQIDSGNFKVPSSTGNYTFILSLGGQKILEQKLEVGGVPVINSISPEYAFAGLPTEFLLSVSGSNITKYEWDFGDNSSKKTTNNNKIQHTYDSIKSYVVKVNVTNAFGNSAVKEFEVQAFTPQQAINKTLGQKISSLKNVTDFIGTLGSWQSTQIKSMAGLGAVETSLNSIQQKFLQGELNDSEYVDMMKELIAIEVPIRAYVSRTIPSSQFIKPGADKISLEAVSEATGESYSSSNQAEVIEAIRQWVFDNVDGTMSSKVISLYFNENTKKDYTFFNLKLQNHGSSATLFVKSRIGMAFQNQMAEQVAGFYPIKFDSNIDISFIIPEDISITDVHYFASPSLSSLEIDDQEYTPSEKPYGKLIILLILIFVFGIFCYGYLQHWYKNKYEDFLFKNKNNLYNLVQFIEDSRKKGMDNQKIRILLGKSGWSGEQIDYIMKKYEGKSTGLPELIPLGIIFGSMKDKEKLNPARGPNVPNIPQYRPLR